MNTEISSLPRLPEVSQPLTRAVEAIVALKYEVDGLRARTTASLIHPSVFYGYSETADSLAFMRACLPFLTTHSESSTSMHVPAMQVAGESWQWKPHNIGRELEESLMAYLTDEARADRRDADYAGYVAWPALGLVVALEGKNRVAFLQSRGAKTIPADVSLAEYPDASRIARHRVNLGGRDEVWAVLDDRYVERVPLHDAGNDVLSAYGVPPPIPWPLRYPTTHEVFELFSDDQVRVDLTPIRMRSAAAHERAVVSVRSLTGLRPRLAPTLGVLMTYMVGAVAAVKCSGWAQLIAAFIVGGLVGGFASLVLPLFTAQREWARGR
jgi:hypothetical protein